MTSFPDDSGEPADRALWQRCRTADASVDEHLRVLDLAAFAEGGLDPDEHERIAAQLLVDPFAAADVAVARELRDNPGENSTSVDRIITRAIALHPGAAGRGLVVSFRRDRQVVLRGLAQWGSLAAALAIAAWLGFTMGSDASLALSRPTLTNQDGAAIELFDPATGFLHDLPSGVQT